MRDGETPGGPDGARVSFARESCCRRVLEVSFLNDADPDTTTSGRRQEVGRRSLPLGTPVRASSAVVDSPDRTVDRGLVLSPKNHYFPCGK